MALKADNSDSPETNPTMLVSSPEEMVEWEEVEFTMIPYRETVSIFRPINFFLHFQNSLEQINLAATKEWSLEQIIAKMKTAWKELNFGLIYRDQSVGIFSYFFEFSEFLSSKTFYKPQV